MDSLPVVRLEGLPADFIGKGERLLATYALNTDSGRVKQFNATQGQDISAEMIGEEHFHVVDATIYEVVAPNDETGEENKWIALALELASGEVLRVNSKPAVRSFVEAVKTFGMPGIRNGVVLFRIAGKKSKKWGKDWYSFRAIVGTPVEDDVKK